MPQKNFEWVPLCSTLGHISNSDNLLLCVRIRRCAMCVMHCALCVVCLMRKLLSLDKNLHSLQGKIPNGSCSSTKKRNKQQWKKTNCLVEDQLSPVSTLIQTSSQILLCASYISSIRKSFQHNWWHNICHTCMPENRKCQCSCIS